MTTETQFSAKVLISRSRHYEQNGDTSRAEDLLSQAIVIQESDSKTDQVELAAELYNLALLNICMDRNERAHHFLTRALAIRRDKLGMDDPATLETVAALSVFRQLAGEKLEANEGEPATTAQYPAY